MRASEAMKICSAKTILLIWRGDTSPSDPTHSAHLQSTDMKDQRQGAAAVVFLIFYAIVSVFITYSLSTRRAKRYIFGVLTFSLIRLGANIATLGWAIHLYDNFDWLVASLILGAEGESRSRTS